MAIGAAVGFPGASFARDLGLDVDIRAWIERFTGLGGAAALAALAYRQLEVS